MEKIVYNLTAMMYPPVEKPWLEPYDSSARMYYYVFENNERLRYVYLSMDELYERKMRIDDMDITMVMNQYTNEKMKEYLRKRNLTIKTTVPVTESCLRLFSAKNEMVRMETPGLFDEILKMPFEIWIGVVMVFSFLTTIEIIEKRIVGIRRKIISCAYDNLFQQFGAILGKGYNISQLPAIRIATGTWFLQVVVLFTLLCAVIKANYLTKHEKNIDSVKDLSRASSFIGLYANINDEYDICHSPNEEMKIACEFINITNEEKETEPDFTVTISKMSSLISEVEKTGYNYEQGMYMSSTGYLCQPLIYNVGRNINPIALKLVNNRLRSFVETSQITPWHRYLEKKLKIDIQPKPTSTVEDEFRKIEWKNVEMAFAVWATQIGVALLAAVLELIIGF